MISAEPILVILPEGELPDFTIDRIEQLLTDYFPRPKHQLIVTVYGKIGDALRRHFGEVREFTPEMLSQAETVVLSEDLAPQLAVPNDKRIYSLEHYRWRVLLHLRTQAIDRRDWPAVDAHAFNRSGPKLGWDCQEYFPYGFIFRECAVGGPIDAFGFRNDADFDALRRRDKNHKLIVILGGSAAWSWYTPYRETFGQRLEARLQLLIDDRRSGEKVTVLNLGQGGSVILHEIIVWTLHAERLHPEIVIIHDGYNDLLFGMTTDPFLIRHDICAPHTFELWSQKLHERSDVQPRFRHAETVRVVNSPRRILSAFVSRKLQLDGLVTAAGAHHIASFQPYAYSKALSEFEQEQVERQRYQWIWGEAQAHIPELYRQASLALSETELPLLDLHVYFQRFGANETLFQDFMHTTPAGDERVAEAYFDHIVERDLV